MSINRIFQTGAESGSVGELEGITTSMTVQTTSPKTGNYYYRFVNANGNFWDCQVPSTYQVRMGGFFCYESENQSPQLLVIGNSYIQWLASTNQMRLYAGGATQGDTTFTFSSGAGNWYHLGFDVKIDPTNGWAYFYVDGKLALSFDGNTGSTPVTFARWGSSNGNYTGYPAWDDMYVDDTTGEGSPAVVPIKRFYPLKVNGTGNYSEFDPSTGSNYECVDEVPPSDSDYVETTVADEFDSYAMDTFTLETNESIVALIPTARIARTGATEEVALGTRYSSTNLVGADQTPGTSFGYLWERQEETPVSGIWNQNAMDNVEFLIKSRGTY